MKTTNETQLPLGSESAAGEQSGLGAASGQTDSGATGDKPSDSQGDGPEADASAASGEGSAASDAAASESSATATDAAAPEQKPATVEPVKPASKKTAEVNKTRDRKPRTRRGPPADGGEEPRKLYILTTSRMADANGNALRRGQVVSVPERRIEALVAAGRIREVSKSEIDRAHKRFGRSRIS